MKWSNRRILVTGAAGFLGSNLTKHLLSKGAYVIALDDFSYGKRENIDLSTNEVINADVLDKNAFKDMRNIDYVFHLGAPSSVVLFDRDPQSCLDVTICGFTNVLEWATDENIRKLVYPSSGSVYGNTSLPQSESTIPNPTNLYGVGKLACEMVARTYQDRVPNVGLRIFAGYGPGEGHKGEFASVVSLFVASILQGKSPTIYGDGTQTRDFVYAGDVIKAMVAAIEKNVENGIVNVGSGISYSFNEVAVQVNKSLGRKIKPIYVDKPQRYLERTLADTSKMIATLGIDPMDLKQGLAEYEKHMPKI